MRSQLLVAASLLLSGAADAQDTSLARWQALHERQPDAISFEIFAAKSEFYAGELIPLQLSFSSTQPQGFLAETRLQDRVGRLNGMEEFLLDPAALAEDPLRGLLGESGGFGGMSGGPIPLSSKPLSFDMLLNEWVRFRKPGTYRIAILSRRVAQISGDRVELVSNILTLRIVPAPAAWVKQQIGDAVRILDYPADPSQAAQERRLLAGRTLRFLESPEAAIELVRHLGSGDDIDSWSLLMGVLGSPYRKRLLPVMEARLVEPDQPVWDRYIDTLARLSLLVASGGPTGASPTNEAIQQKRKEYVARLIASLPAKEPEARVVSTTNLVDSAGRDGGDATWLPAVAASIVADFRSLPVRTQLNLLQGRWNIIAGPAMLPILREIYAPPRDAQAGIIGEPWALRDIAVRRIYELAPEEGRRIILRQITRPDTSVSLSTLGMLPDGSLPELNNLLANRADAGQLEDGLILRYATGDIVQRVERAYLKRNQDFDRQKLPHCGGPLVYYFLKYDPAFGESELRSDFSRPALPPVCYDIGFQFLSLDRNAYSPALERLAIDLLNSPAVPIKRGAAEVLGKYGSPAAQKPLWDTLEYFHSWWEGREEQMDEGNQQLERTLRIALAQADGWTLQEEELNRIFALCSTNWCRQEVTGWLAKAAP
jgi:hypothetical protein